MSTLLSEKKQAAAPHTVALTKAPCVSQILAPTEIAKADTTGTKIAYTLQLEPVEKLMKPTNIKMIIGKNFFDRILFRASSTNVLNPSLLCMSFNKYVMVSIAKTNTMVSNLIGQGKSEFVIPVIKKISYWSLGFCSIIIILLNVFPTTFFNLFGQDNSFLVEGIPVIRMVSLGLILMSIANIWLNAVTGTGKTRINLLIEIIAILMYLIYTWYFMKYHYISLAIAWSNEFIYWGTIFTLAFVYLNSGKWKNKAS